MAWTRTLQPMLAGMVGRIPSGPDWLYEPKWDGFRCLAGVEATGAATLLSRRGTDLARAFPDVAAVVAERVPADTVVDGEIVRWAADGHLDFEALQRRNRSPGRGARELARTEPCHLIVFDVLRLHGEDLTGLPLAQRRQRLEELLPEDRSGALVLGLQTDDRDTAVVWFDRLADVGVEGIVAKRASGPYRPGVRGWSKIKRFATTEAIVGGVTGSLQRPESLIIGRVHSDGVLRVAGHSTELPPAVAAELAGLIVPAGDEHPWPAQLPPGWHERAARDYHRVRPEVVAELRVDVAITYADGAPSHWRHRLRFLRLRPDLTAEDVPMDLDLER